MTLNEAARVFARGFAKISGKADLGAESRVDAAFSVVEDYDRLASEVYRERARGGAGLTYAEDLLASSAQSLLAFAARDATADSAYVTFIKQYRGAFRANFGIFIFTATLFIATCFLGWNIGTARPEYVPIFVPQRIMEMVHDNQAWYAELQKNPIEGAWTIAWNNMQVSLTGFLFGALFGLGSIYILATNGLMFGALLGYCSTHGFEESLTIFVASHGPLELSLIVASCFAGLLIGRVFYQRPYSLFRVRMRAAGQEAGVLATGIIPWLLLAGCFEAFVSPWPTIDFSTKAVCGSGAAALFWYWTFKPLPKRKSN